MGVVVAEVGVRSQEAAVGEAGVGVAVEAERSETACVSPILDGSDSRAWPGGWENATGGWRPDVTLVVSHGAPMSQQRPTQCRSLPHVGPLAAGAAGCSRMGSPEACLLPARGWHWVSLPIRKSQ